MRFILVCIIALATLGCPSPGSLEIGNNTAGTDGGLIVIDTDLGFPPDGAGVPDTGRQPDAPSSDDVRSDDVTNAGPDVETPDAAADVAMCDPSMCGAGASCRDNRCQCDEGLFGDPLTGCAPTNPCENVTCPGGASCNPDGSCSCDPFFDDDGAGGCTPQGQPADLTTRTKADVCDIWTSTHPSPGPWLIEPVAECDQGVMHPDELRNALHRASQHRMLVGLYPVSLAAGQIDNVQQCATMMAANNALDHNPPSSWKCYTPEGAAGAGSSNLALGYASAAATVDGYMRDGNTPSLGHRRWVINPAMAATAFGQRGRGGCMYAFGGGRNHSPPMVAYPAPGPFPRDAILGNWSIGAPVGFNDQYDVTIMNLTTGTPVTVTNVYVPDGNYGNLPALAWTVDTAQLPVDNDYEVTITDGGGATAFQYVTTLVSCP